MQNFDYNSNYQAVRRIETNTQNPLSNRQNSEAMIANRPGVNMGEYRSPSRDNPLSYKFTNGLRSASQSRNFHPGIRRNVDNSDNVSVNSSSSRNPLQLGFGESRRIMESQMSSQNFNRYRKDDSINLSISQNKNVSRSIDRNIQSRVDFRSSSNSTNSNIAFASRNQGIGIAPRNQTREDTEMLKSKNKALMSVNKNQLKDFLGKLVDMKSTVQRNIKFSFTTRLRDIWASYIRDQKQKNKPINEEELMNELRPIEDAAVDSLNAQTDLMIQDIKIQQLQEIQSSLETKQQVRPDIDDPLYNTELDYNISRDKLAAFQEQYNQLLRSEENNALELKNKYRNLMEKHIDSYNREYKIKFANDHSLAMSELQKARTVYKEKIDQMQREMKRGPQSSQTYTQEQIETIEKLKKRIKEARDSSGGYNSRALYQA